MMEDVVTRPLNPRRFPFNSSTKQILTQLTVTGPQYLFNSLKGLVPPSLLQVPARFLVDLMDNTITTTSLLASTERNIGGRIQGWGWSMFCLIGDGKTIASRSLLMPSQVSETPTSLESCNCL